MDGLLVKLRESGWYTKWYTTGILSIPYLIYSVHGWVACSLEKVVGSYIGVVCGLYCDDFLLVYKTYYNLVKSMLMSIVFPF